MELITHLRGVRVLCAVDAHGSFTAAARELGLTQSAVSQHVATLERHLDVSLVDRGSRPAGLTEAGHALARHGRSLLARIEDAEQELAEVVGGGPGGSGSAASRPRWRRSCRRRWRASATSDPGSG